MDICGASGSRRHEDPTFRLEGLLERGIPEMMVYRIFVFMWSVGVPRTRRSPNPQASCSIYKGLKRATASYMEPPGNFWATEEMSLDVYTYTYIYTLHILHNSSVRTLYWCVSREAHSNLLSIRVAIVQPSNLSPKVSIQSWLRQTAVKS